MKCSAQRYRRVILIFASAVLGAMIVSLLPSLFPTEAQTTKASAAFDKILTVTGEAAGFRRDGPGVGDVPALHLAGTNLERVDCSLHGPIRQPPGAIKTSAEANRFRESIDHPEAVMLWAGNQKPAIIGSKVDGGEGLWAPPSLRECPMA